MPEFDDNQNDAAGADADLASTARSLGKHRWVSWLVSKGTRVSRFLSSKSTHFLGAGGIIVSLASYVGVRAAPYFEGFWKSNDHLLKLGLLSLIGLVACLVVKYAYQRSRQQYFKDMAKIWIERERQRIDQLVASRGSLEANPETAKLVAEVLDTPWKLDDQNRVLQTRPTPHAMHDASSTLPGNMADDLDARQAEDNGTTDPPAGERATA